MINWDFFSFDFFINNFEGIKKEYDNLFVPFFNRNEIRNRKTYIYSLKMSTKKKDVIWELLNNDLIIEEIEDDGQNK